ncbi:MAG: glycosyltransferase family 9 protein [Spirosomataceae bacterium]
MRTYSAGRKLKYFLWLIDVVVDAYARLFYKRRKRGTPNTVAPHFLLISFGHLGDALTFSYLFPIIKKQYPAATIDVLVGDWCEPMLAHNPYIRRMVYLNHFRNNRRPISFWAKLKAHWETTRQAIRQLRTQVYDYSIDIRYSDTVSHFILPCIQVKKAIGFGDRGFGGLLDIEHFLPQGDFHHTTMYALLLHDASVRFNPVQLAPYFSVQSSVSAVQHRLGLSAPTLPYVMICPEAGLETKMVPITFWADWCKLLLQHTHFLLVFSGQRSYTIQLYEQVLKQHPDQHNRLFNAVSKLTLDEIAALSQQAHWAFTMDSLPAHLCSVFCSTVSFFYKSTSLQFLPLAAKPSLVFHNQIDSQIYLQTTVVKTEAFEVESLFEIWANWIKNMPPSTSN